MQIKFLLLREVFLIVGILQKVQVVFKKYIWLKLKLI